jgi:predicted methyltransferase
MKLLRCLLLPAAAVALCLTPGLRAQTPPPPPHPTSTPYSGDLGIFEEPNRDQKLHIDRVMSLLGMKPGKDVADIGAGGGWFTVRAARRVGPQGKVYAEDINQHAVDAIRDRAAKEKLGNIEPVLGTPDDPKLAPGSVDAILLLKVYHEVANTPALLAHLREAMRPGAKLGIIDRNGNGADHGLAEKIVREELERAGFRQVGHYDFTKDDGQDYFLIFQKK